MPIPDERDMTTWLERCGTPSGHARQAMSILPRDLWRPLFLRLAVGLPRDALKSEAALVHRVVEHYSGELAAALRRHGAGPSAAEVRESIGALAWSCMTDPADTVPRSAARASGDLWRVDGERSLFGRAVACGLLRIRSRDRLAFTHTFFQEAFAAAVAPNGAVAWDERVDALRPESRRARLGALIDRLPDPEPLLDALLARDPVLALWCASRVSAGLSDPVTERLLPHVEQLLQSRFRSDRRTGLELLGRLRGPRARAFVANWVRSLSADRLTRWAPYVALALWEQRLPEPFGLLLQHPRLRLPDGMPWIEPAFVEEVAALPETFREAVRVRALRVANCDPDLGEAARDSAQLLLALLGDQRLVQILRARLAREGRLGPSDHRLLIFLDTEESIALYADSAEAYLTEIRAISRNDDSDGSRRSNLMHDIVLKHSDIAMFPHDRLLEVVECALDTPDPLLAWFGLEWLHIVIAVRLIPAVCRATYTLRGHLFVDPRLPDERLAGRTTVEALVDQFHRGDSDVRQFVVRQLAAHHEDAAVDFLCQLLNDPDLAGHAARSLGQLGSGRAVPFLVAAVDGSDPTKLSELVRALGVLGHPAAVPALGRALSRCIAERESRGGERRREWAEYQLLVSLGGLGGVALDLLREVWDRIEHRAVVRALVARGGAAEIEFVLDALDSEPELMADVVKCLGSYDPDAFLPHYTTRARPFLPHLDDERLLQCVLDHAGIAPTEDVVEAIARFSNPRARAYLRGVAANDTLPIDSRSMYGRTPRGRAIGLLVELGDEEYVRRAVADEVERVMALDHPHPMHFRELPRWALRERARDLVAADPRPRWVRLLRWFAQPEDRTIFEDLEKSSNDKIAEEAHEFLTWPGFLLDGR